MKILVLTVSDQQHHQLNQYIDLHRTYDFKNWVEGFKGLKHECFFFDYYQSFVEDGSRVMEEKILKIVQSTNVDVVVIPNIYYEVGVHFLSKLKQYAAKSILVFFDDSSRFESTSRFYVGLCDFIVTHESANALKFYDKYHVKVDFFPCYPSYNYYQNIIQHNADDLTQPQEVCFIGAKIADREAYVNTLQSADIPLIVYGKGWSNGIISQSKMVNLFATSKISLNFTKSASQNGLRQLKARAFEIVMSGGFLLTEHDDELADYFDVGTEIDTFRSAEECISKISFFLKNPEVRSTMREKAFNKTKDAYSLESAWMAYLNSLSGRVRSVADKITLIQVPKQAISSFINWNIQIAIGRARIGQFGACIDQTVFCLREARYLAEVYSTAIVWRLIVKEFIGYMTVGLARKLLTKFGLRP